MPAISSAVKVLQSTDGTSIYAEATGSPQNPHVVLLAGLCMSGCVFDDMCADHRLLDTLYIVRYDVRGHGRSGKPTTPLAYESKLFADDFKTVMVAFGLKAAVATDVVAHLPPATLSGVVYLSGMPTTGDLAVGMAAPGLVAALPGLLSKDDVPAFHASCMYLGLSLSTDIMGLSLSRPMDVEKLWAAGKEGLPLLIVQGSVDGHREGGAQGVEDIMKPYFKNYEAVWLEGRGHALHYECPEEITELLIKFVSRVGGKDYRT
ncbi:alpha/beta-hydrolase [Mycena vulgaris]|nr:alpha/beta-hydrolase [Mycena vulgaris]